MTPKIKLVRYSTFSLLKTLAFFISPYGWRFILASLFRLSADLAWLYPAYALAKTVTFFSNYTPGQPLRDFWIVLILWALASLWRFAFMYYGKYWGFQIAEKIAIDAELKTIRHLFYVDIGWHEKENAGNKLKKIDRGKEGLNKIVKMWYGSFIEIGVNLVGVTFIISKFDRAVALLMILFFVTYYGLSYFYTRKASNASQIVNVKEEEMSGLLFEVVNNIRSVKIMSMITPLFRILKDQATKVFDAIKHRIFWFQSGSSTKAAWAQVFRLGILVFICFGIMRGQYEIGFLILFYSYFGEVLQSITELANSTQEFTIAKYAIGRMTEMLAVPIKIDKEEGKVAFPKDWKKITVSNLTFAYGDKKVLSSVSFEIKRGEKLGIIGLSGAGKSTLLKMLLKEHEQYEGNISFDDISLKDIQKKDYFEHVAVVLQETEVFNFSLRDNVTLSNHVEAKNETLIKRSLDIAHVTEFTRSLQSGIDTHIGEKGVRLSGGEKQRVGIARAIFKNPQILLLDEATSHLDIESEERIRDSLHQFFKTVTAVVIAHRLTTIKEMDRILVLEDGKILETGTFSELYSKKGRFYELWEKQKL